MRTPEQILGPYFDCQPVLCEKASTCRKLKFDIILARG